MGKFKNLCLLFPLSILISLELNAKPFKSGELVSRQQFLYGAFEARLKASIGSGGISAFFLLKDNSWAGAEWQELDFEFFGKSNGREFQTQIMTPGEPRTENVKTFKTSGNFSSDFHIYRIEWAPDYLAFYYDSKLIRRENGRNRYAKFLDPGRVEPMRVRLSLWAGFSNWSGRVVAGQLPTPVYVDFVRYERYDKASRSFKFAWQDDFDRFDASRWQKANWTFEYAVNDFSPENVTVRNGTLKINFSRQ